MKKQSILLALCAALITAPVFAQTSAPRGEMSPEPAANQRKYTPEERAAARAERREKMTEARKAGELKATGEEPAEGPGPKYKSPVESFKERAEERKEMSAASRRGDNIPARGENDRK